MEWYKALQKIRKQNFSQKEVADLLITTQQQYSKYETNQQEMTVSRIIELCNLFKVSADQLLGINYYENEEGKTISKYEELKREIIGLIKWANYENIISDNAESELEYNLYRIFQDLDKK